jgi:uncharacterized protein
MPKSAPRASGKRDVFRIPVNFSIVRPMLVLTLSVILAIASVIYTAMKNGCLQAGVYALFIDIMVIRVTFRNGKHTALAMVPLLVTILWTHGRMGSVGFQMNLSNLISFPRVFGIPVVCGIHPVHRYRGAPHLIDALANGSTVQAINLATFTTVIGFGSLLAAKHQGIYSLGLLMTVTLSIGGALSLILLPAVLTTVGSAGKSGELLEVPKCRG